MKYLAVLAMTLLLAGCATTIRSDVTAFNAWPAAPQDKSYAFVAPPAKEDTLEYRGYLNLVRAELGKLGFAEAARADAATLRVTMEFATVDKPVAVIEAVDPFWMGPRHGRFGPGFYSGFYPGFYPYPRGFDPYGDLYGVPLQETLRHYFERQLRVVIDGADGKKLFDVTARNISTEPATSAIMPALVVSAFAGFPGENGVPRQVVLKQQ
ncbi:MAG TPA: DUF4136 domain-containing protein [Janthinobacterium sp.]|nr:DUF4136 domain-containing protein [Janthinobacterium sp.]